MTIGRYADSTATKRTTRSRNLGTLTLTLCSGVLCAFVSGCTTRQLPLEEFLNDFAGPAAINCGRFKAFDASEADVERAMAYAITARTERKAFFVINDDLPFDSQIATGFASKGDENAMFFFYDSAPCGGPDCPSRFLLKACQDPQSKKERRRVKLVCE